ncbi:MAG: DUF3987 domain-containing protein [Planctomycetales bacterium]|nr:DUF3987 domain-containing protein [Planctomycetales bacterium]
MSLKKRITVLVDDPDKIGQRTVIACLDGEEVHRDHFNVDSAKDRLRFADVVSKRFGNGDSLGWLPVAIVEAAERVDGEALEADTDWPAPGPLPESQPPVEPFSFDLLPESLRPWIEDISERMQCPPDYAAAGAMIVLAGIVGRKVAIRPKQRDDWTVVPNLWGVIIGRPGLLKTPAVNEPLNVLKRLEIEAKKVYAEELRQHEITAMVSKARRKQAEKELAAAIKDGGDPDAIAAGMIDEETQAPVRGRYLVNDATVEKAGELLNENANGLTVFRDELRGLLKALEKEGQEGARAFYLEAWNGTNRFTYDRIGRGTVDIEAACLSIIGAIQPGPLSEYLRGAIRGGAADDGLIQRFQIAVWPDAPSTWRNVDRWPETSAKQAAFDAYKRLDELQASSIGATQDHDDELPYLRFDQQAQRIFDDWRAELERRLRQDDEHPAFEAHLSKFRSLVPSLALLIWLADETFGSSGSTSQEGNGNLSGVLPEGVGSSVSSSALEKAIAWAEYLESHARRIYSPAIQSDAAGARALATKIQSRALEDGFNLKAVYRPGWSCLANREEAEAAVDLLIDLHWLKSEHHKTSGRPATCYRVNPKILANPSRNVLPKVPKAPSGSFGSSPQEGNGKFSGDETDSINRLFDEAVDLGDEDAWHAGAPITEDISP